ncbi:hypothetical protein [Arsenicicoccus dermatophilus]|uniref:hypothetical protein n=1 Tax=Arsenicicoccus dermatophilus TaxID=1076331 RepID=UPI001F4D1DD0|nr:hypothetical protein [Arsenicicoccus dermatophilus]MCH8612141.1 hypothetical protein [Arsenicicoccus dermatophilus]
MSATTTQGLAPDQDLDVVDYVARVRRALDDLDAEVVGELTLGMEADLAEIRAEAGSLVERLGVPERCADELRAAADLPPRAAVAPRARGMRGATARIASGRERTRRHWERAVVDHPWLRPCADYVRTLRPAWWLLRGFLAVWVLGAGLTWDGPIAVLALGPAIVGSVWLGARGAGSQPSARRALLAGNVVAVAAALVFGAKLVDRFLVTGPISEERVVYVDQQVEGLVHDGEHVANLFVYDEQGRRVPRARLVTDTGKELTGQPPVVGVDQPRVVDIYGRSYTNVFPVAQAGQDPWRHGNGPDRSTPSWVPPTQVAPLAAATPAVGATPSATVTPSPTATASASASATVVPPVSPGATRPSALPGATTGPAAASTPVTGAPTAPTVPSAATVSAATGLPAPR